MISLSFSVAEVNIQKVWMLMDDLLRAFYIKYLRKLHIVLKLILLDNQLDEIVQIRIIAANLTQLIHMITSAGRRND